MIEIKRKSDLIGKEKYGQCASCARTDSEAELYKLFFTCNKSTRNSSIDLCWDCLLEMGNDIYNKYITETPHL